MSISSAELMLRPMVESNRAVRWATVLLATLTVVWLATTVRVMIAGHTMMGTSSYSAPWGLTVANIIHIIGISHVGIAVSAAVRLLGLGRYRNVARLAEIVTLIALLMAVINIALDVGRPDRFIVNTLVHGRWHAPMVWSATVISLYLMASSIYLYLSMRRDFWILSETRLPLGRLYRLLALGYRDSSREKERHERTLFWLALALVPIMVSVHSVYGLFFGLLTAKAGWYNPLQAPYFVLGAVVSGISALIVLAAIVRRVYRWDDIIDNRTFRVLGAVLAFVVFLYLYFVGSEQLTAQYAARPSEKAASDALLRGEFSVFFWLTLLGGLVAPLMILLWQLLRNRPVRVGVIAGTAALVNVAMLVKRVLLVVPPQLEPALPLPYFAGAYQPTPAELVTTLGTYAFGALLLVGLLKVVPLLELPGPSSHESDEAPGGDRMPTTLVALMIACAAALIVWGVMTRDQDFAPLKWLSGLTLLASVPLIICLTGPGEKQDLEPEDAGEAEGKED